MAGTTVTSKTLFTKDNGDGMVFFMRPCNERQLLRPIIENGGGTITSKLVPDSIKLAEIGSRVSSDDYISTKFIKDCVDQNKLLDTNPYKVRPGIIVRADSTSSDDSVDIGFDSDDSMSPAPNIKHASREKKGRSQYTREDDLLILNYLLDERRYNQATGMKVYKDMEIMKVTNHSAQSMNTRYRKQILPNIEQYRNDIGSSGVSKFTGFVSKQPKDDTYSVDALFPADNKKQSSKRFFPLAFSTTYVNLESKKQKQNDEEMNLQDKQISSDLSKDSNKNTNTSELSPTKDNNKHNSASNLSPQKGQGKKRAIDLTPQKGQGKKSAFDLTPQKGQGEKSASDLTPQKGQGKKSAIDLTPQKGQGEKSAIDLTPQKGQGKKSAIDLTPQKGQGKKSAIDLTPQKGQGEKSASDLTPQKGQGKKRAGDLTPQKGQGKKRAGDLTPQKGQRKKRAGDFSPQKGQGKKSANNLTPQKGQGEKSASDLTPHKALRQKNTDSLSPLKAEDQKNTSDLSPSKHKSNNKNKNNSNHVDKLTVTGNVTEVLSEDEVFDDCLESTQESYKTAEEEPWCSPKFHDKGDNSKVTTRRPNRYDKIRQLKQNVNGVETNSPQSSPNKKGTCQNTNESSGKDKPLSKVANKNSTNNQNGGLDHETENIDMNDHTYCVGPCRSTNLVEKNNTQKENDFDSQATDMETVGTEEQSVSDIDEDNSDNDEASVIVMSNDGSLDSLDRKLLQTAKRVNGNKVVEPCEIDTLTNGSDELHIISDDESSVIEVLTYEEEVYKEWDEICNELSEHYGLSFWFVADIFFNCNANKQRTVAYINYGPYSSLSPPWTMEHDEVCIKNPSHIGLISKYGQEDVQYRYKLLSLNDSFHRKPQDEEVHDAC